MNRSDGEAAQLTHAAMAALASGDHVAARRFADELLVRNGADPNARQVLGALALEAGDVATAISHLERANEAAPNQALILNTLGVALRRAGETVRARAMLTQAGKLGLAEAWSNLGNLETDTLAWPSRSATTSS